MISKEKNRYLSKLKYSKFKFKKLVLSLIILLLIQSSNVTAINCNNIDNNVPINSGSFKSYMDYRTITSRSSKQYKIQKLAYTDNYGLRRFDVYFIVATGSYYGDVGDILRIELDTGEYFLAIKGDMKADIHTDKNNQIAHDGSIVEFIVDSSKLDRTAKRMGNISYISGFDGCVVNIEKIGEYGF